MTRQVAAVMVAIPPWSSGMIACAAGSKISFPALAIARAVCS